MASKSKNFFSSRFGSLQPKHLGLGLLALALLLWMLSGMISTKQSVDNEHEKGENELFYAVQDSKAELHSSTIAVTGTTISREAVTLASQVSGMVTKVYAKQGSFLKRGSPILSIYDADVIAQAEQAKAKLASTSLSYQSTLALFNKGFSSQLELHNATANHNQAKAELALANKLADETTIRAPFDGYLDTLHVQKGDIISIGGRGSNLGYFMSQTTMKVQAYISSVQRKLLTPETEVEVVIPPSTDVIKGSIRSISKMADSSSAMFLVEIQLKPTSDQEVSLLGGEDVKVYFKTPPALSHHLPQSALGLDEHGNLSLKTIEQDKAVSTVIGTYEQSNSGAIITDQDSTGVWIQGLPENITVISTGHAYIQAGDSVSTKK